jgi:putative cardiolipin synthase
VHTAYVRYRLRMLRSPVNLYELSPGRTTANPRIGSFGMSLGRLHAKTVAIDGGQVFIGSMNLDPRSATQNTEMGIVVSSTELAQEVLRIVDISRLQNSYRVRLSASSGAIEWLTIEDGREVVLPTEPETGRLQRFYLNLIAPFIPESLL